MVTRFPSISPQKLLRLLLLSLSVCLLFVLCGCGAESAPAETPEPSPTPSPEVTSYVVTDEHAYEILQLADIDSLQEVDGTQSTEYHALLRLQELRPDVHVFWNYTFEGVSYPSDTTTSLTVKSITGLDDAVRFLPNLTYIDLLYAGATVDDLDRYTAINPNLDFNWAFELEGFAIRTDIRCFSTLRDLNYHRYTDEELYPLLRYCKHMRALDLGHNALTNSSIELIGQMTDLEVLILADNYFSDASPLGNLTKLFYMEIFMCHKIEDFSFLNNLTNMKDINLCYCDNLNNLDFLANMPEISFGMFKYSGISQEELDKWKAVYPDAKLVIYDGSIHSCEGGWRDTERNAQIRYNFAAWRAIYDYETYTDVTYDFDNINYIYWYEFKDLMKNGGQSTNGITG